MTVEGSNGLATISFALCLSASRAFFLDRVSSLFLAKFRALFSSSYQQDVKKLNTSSVENWLTEISILIPLSKYIHCILHIVNLANHCAQSFILCRPSSSLLFKLYHYFLLLSCYNPFIFCQDSSWNRHMVIPRNWLTCLLAIASLSWATALGITVNKG